MAVKKERVKKTVKPESAEVEKEQPLDQEEQNLRDLATEIQQFLDEKKSADILVMDLYRVNPYFKYFMIATATSQSHLKSLVREIKKRYGHLLPDKRSGLGLDDVASGWVIIDLIDIVIHLFLKEQREYYNLERLWGDADQLQLLVKEKRKL